MSGSVIPARVTATPAARRAITALAEGEPEDFSPAAGDNLHFVTLSPACATPSTGEVS